MAMMAGGLLSCSGTNTSPVRGRADMDERLRTLLARAEVTPMEKPAVSPAKAELGRLLFFDWILSGNKNISCATCHLPQAATGDALPLPMGEGGKGAMAGRTPPRDDKGNPVFVRRNSPEIFNRGDFRTMFWDGRVTMNRDDPSLSSLQQELLDKIGIATPAGLSLPPGLDNVLAAQAMFPPTSDVEMRGNYHENVIGDMEYWQWQEIWSHLMERLLALAEYRRLFREAYPDIPLDEMTFVQAANAIAAFEIDSFTFYDSPFDRYLRGDDQALNEQQKRGGLLFYGKANCASCHGGPLMTDELFHNRAVPQIGPGKGDLPGGGPDGTWDAGRGGVTGMSRDYYCFRTPPLRNVEKTGPWMHDGVFSTLEAAVRHELDPLGSARRYKPEEHLPEIYVPACRPGQTDKIMSMARPQEVKPVRLSEQEVADLLAFLTSLTSPSLDTLVNITPKEVPSGLPIDG